MNSCPDFSNARVLIVGDVMLDEFYYGSTDKISPEAPVPVVKIKNNKYKPGGAGNVACNITSLGGKAVILSIVGDDKDADILSDLLQQHNVECCFNKQKEYTTIKKLRIMSQNQQLIRLDFENNRTNLNDNLLIDKFKTLLNNVDVVVLSDYNKGVLNNPQLFIKIANKKNIPVLIDPKTDDFKNYQGATLITPNLKEFEQVVGKTRTNKDITTKAFDLLLKHNIKSLLITRSEKGMTLVQNHNNKAVIRHLPTEAQDVYDVTGAGDTVIALMALSLAIKISYETAMKFANIGAGIVVSKIGTATTNINEINQQLLSPYLHHSFIVDKKTLKENIDNCHLKQEKVVMTNGCFDIIHAGHISYLNQAASLGDRLIIAVNSDQSVKKLKGDNRPINSLSDRMAVLSSLLNVDWIISFDDDTPKDLICFLKPDILVKGGDYKKEEVAGFDCVKEVKILNFVDNKSTTKLINKIKGE
ncbi:MAG: bifunctional heptose 7-phosphate kinase/heptose 1-phosphate adenyltransferase [Gammaproteobacteria bacterium]|nr:MAG: bifunctional heptose 7-phosphate kinase/heptose 1-phosphate adenyltransferase [Gammaproteobacteria bacterium]